MYRYTATGKRVKVRALTTAESAVAFPKKSLPKKNASAIRRLNAINETKLIDSNTSPTVGRVPSD